MTSENQTRRPWRRIALVLALLTPFVAFALVPAGLSSGPGRRLLLKRANRQLAPGRLEVASFQFSWFRPTRLRQVALVDREGRRVVDAPRARWDRNLWQILFDAPRLGTLVLERPALELERKEDGTINLLQTLQPILRKDPKLDLRIVVVGGRLRLRSAGVPEPILADQADLTIHLPPAPRPMTWNVALAHGADPGRAATLALEGQYQRWDEDRGQPADLTLSVKGSAWPWTIAGSKLHARGVLHGELSLDRRGGHWASTGDVRITDLDAAGSVLAGDHLRLEQVKGVWDVSQAGGTWGVRRLDLTSSLATFQASGVPTGASRAEGSLDLAALAEQLPHALRLRDEVALVKGSAQLTVSSRHDADRQLWDVEARLSDLRARDRGRDRDITLKSPATLSAHVARQGDSLTVERLALASAFLNAEGQGDVDRGLAMKGHFDLKALQHQLEELVDFGPVGLSGQGVVSGRYQRTGERYEGSLETDLRDLRIEGFGPSPIGRDAARLAVVLQGAAGDAGLPDSWTTARADFTSGSLAVNVGATAQGPLTAWNTTARTPLRLGGRDHDAQVTLAATTGGREATPLRLDVALASDNTDPIRLAASGSFDRAKGALRLTPVGDEAASRAVRITTDGITVTGIGSKAFRAEGAVVGDLAVLGRLLAPNATGLRGTWSARASAEQQDEGLRIVAQVDARDLPEDVEGPVTVSLDVLAPSGSERIQLSELTLASSYATVEVSGGLSGRNDERQLELNGTISPGWGALSRLVARRVDPRASLAGKPGKLALKARLSELSVDAVRESLEGTAGFELTEANFFGMRLGKVAVGLSAAGGKVQIAPIDTSINEGRLHLEPTVAFDDNEGATLRLGPESSVKDASINDEVSHRVLSFVAPVLESATRVRGRVSVALEEAAFPLGGGDERHAEVDGTVTFQDVEFIAGPLVDDLMGVIGREPKMALKLNKPVALAIADGRVQTEGLALPLGNVTEITLDGWVDFNRNLNLTASLPVTRKMVGNIDFLGDIVEGTKVSVPIRGTLKQPEIDRDALQVGMKELGKTLLERTAGRGAAELLLRMTRPRDPNAPPRLTPRERRAQRQERRMQRRAPVPPEN